jgi:hypothetical protein
MPRVRLFHWRAAETKPLIDAITGAGYEVDYPGDKVNGNFRSIRESVFHAAVIDLTRMPSHGCYVGAALRAGKSTRYVPLVFVDGEPEKVERVRKQLPDAIYTSRAKLPAALKRAKPLANPATPPTMMQSYRDRTTAQKLGIQENMQVGVLDAPPDYAKAIGVLPSGASLEEDPSEPLPITLWFVHDPDTYLSNLARMRRLAAKTRIWIVWPKGGSKKGAASGVTPSLIREAALSVGLVDYKICSVNETWSGMLFTVKK